WTLMRTDGTWKDGNGRNGTWRLDSTQTRIVYDYSSGLVVEAVIVVLTDSIFVTDLTFHGVPARTHMSIVKP
ncbi:MAG: hypothetical protein RMM53_13155, partial [Bacteroidia bacterium]|nr:hypothetical protein [Bacteroidia bacterium]